MQALIVVAHPDAQSLSHAIAREVAAGVTAAGHEAVIADLAAEGFDPRFNATDIAVHRARAPFPPDVVAEQARIDRADALVLVFPIYWWSMPGQMKGWIDRVFVNGWAYDEIEGKSVKLLHRLKVHLIGLGAADTDTYQRRGYAGAMKIQIDHGIFDYCGAPVISSTLLPSVTEGAAPHLATALALGRILFTLSATSSAA